MDTDTGVLLGVVAVLALNRLVRVGEGWERRQGLFWFMQVLNLAAACFMVLAGIPEFRARDLHVINLFLAGLLVLHILLNNRAFTAAWRESAADRSLEAQQRRQAVLDKLRDGPPQA